jgi:hypothetical protein
MISERMKLLQRMFAFLSLLGLIPLVCVVALTVLSHVTQVGPREEDLGAQWVFASGFGLYGAFLFAAVAEVAPRLRAGPSSTRYTSLAMIMAGALAAAAFIWIEEDSRRLLVLPLLLVEALGFYVIGRDLWNRRRSSV